MSILPRIGPRLRLGLLACLLLLVHTGQAQYLDNGWFWSNSCASGHVSPFYVNCVSSWSASHGSPQLDGRPHPYGTFYAYMWSNSITNVGEGIFQPLSGLVPGVVYNLHFVLRGHRQQINGDPAGSATLAARITTNLTSGGTGAPAGTPIPTGINVVWQQNVSPLIDDMVTWTSYDLQFSVPTTATYQLWLYPLIPASQDQITEVNVSQIGIWEASCINSTVLYQNTSSLRSYTASPLAIRAGSQVNPAAPAGPVQVLSGQDVQFIGGQEVELAPGFSAEPGSYFSAESYAVTCRPAAPTPPPPPPTAWSAPAPEQTVTEAVRIGRQQRIKVYPNPASAQVTITLASAGDSPLTQQALLYNSLGQEVNRYQLRTGDNLISVQGLPKGIYYLHTSENGVVTKTRLSVIR